MSTRMNDVPTDHTALACSPVQQPLPGAGDESDQPAEGIGLCLSGGGYRAMLFHAGSLWRLNELGLLPRLDRVSSVSGGSITAGLLGLRWRQLQWQNGVAVNLETLLLTPLRALARQTLDARSILTGIVLPGSSIGDRIATAYARQLYGKATLQDLPGAGEGPRFVINATSVQTGALVRFSQPYVADWRVGRAEREALPLSKVVAASSAFPPVLSPVEIDLPKGAMQPTPGADLHREPFTTRLVLTDGGVFDNLGLETVWKRYRTVLVSDGGGQMEPEPKPHADWARHGLRINTLIDNQVRALRKRQVVGSFERKERLGSYWRMRADIGEYPAPDKLPCPPERALQLAHTPTRLAAMDDLLQERIINLGYALADAAIRGWVESGRHAPPEGFPYPQSAV